MAFALRLAAVLVLALALPPLPAAAAEAGGVVRGVSPDEIVVGTHMDLSGPLAVWGAAVRNGLVMAFDEVNEEGGVHGRTLRLIAEDDGYDTSHAEQAVRKLVAHDRVFAILAPAGTPTVQASMRHALEQGVLHLFPLSEARQAYAPFHALKFGARAPLSDQMRAGLGYLLHQHGPLRVAILLEEDELGFGVTEGAVAELSRRGLEPATMVPVARDAEDFGTEIANLRANGSEIVVLGVTMQTAIGAMETARASGWRPIFLCSSACYVPEIATFGGGAVERLLAVGQFAVPRADDPHAGLRAWVARYERKFTAVATAQALYGATMGHLFVEALKRAGAQPTQANFAKALEDMEPWTDPALGGVPIDFTAENHLGARTGFLAQMRGGRWVQLTGPLDAPD